MINENKSATDFLKEIIDECDNRAWSMDLKFNKGLSLRIYSYSHELYIHDYSLTLEELCFNVFRFIAEYDFLESYKLTDEEYRLIAHSLGIDVYKGGSEKLPKEFYRNRIIIAEYDNPINDFHFFLFDKHYTHRKNCYYSVSEVGIELFRRDFEDYRRL